MTALKLDKFGGTLPAWDDRLLPDGQASYSLNCYLFSGSLIGWRQPKLLRYVTRFRRQIRLPAAEQGSQRYQHHGEQFAGWSSRTRTPPSSTLPSPTISTSVITSPHPPIHRNTTLAPGSRPASRPGCSASRPRAARRGWTSRGGGDVSQVGNTTVLPGARGANWQAGNSIFLTPIVPDGRC